MLTREALEADGFWNAGLLHVGHEPYSSRIPADARTHTPIALLAALHVAPEPYDRRSLSPEIVPLAHPRGERHYAMAHVFRAVPIKQWADPEATHLITVGEQLHKCGDAQAWYYPEDRLLVVWEVLAFRYHPRELDKARVADVWRRLESWLRERFPQAERVATLGGDPAWEPGVDWYKAMLEHQGYAAIDDKVRGAWVKDLARRRERER